MSSWTTGYEVEFEVAAEWNERLIKEDLPSFYNKWSFMKLFEKNWCCEEGNREKMFYIKRIIKQ